MKENKAKNRAENRAENRAKNRAENREYKSDLFSMLMQEPCYALEVYNVLNGTSHTDPNLVEMVKLENGISLTIRNDASFIVDMRLNLYEHQSTKCPNMPLRSLIYIAGLLKDYVAENEFDLQGTRMIQIPTPKFVVFYNGLENAPEREVLRLSDCYMNKKDAPELEIYCTIININQGNNEEMMQRCSVLSEYTTFVETVVLLSGKKVDGHISIDLDIY